MSTKTNIKNAKTILMILVALVLAFACFAGGGLLVTRAVDGEGDTATTTGITVTKIKRTIPNLAANVTQPGSDIVHVFADFSESAATEEVANLQDKDEYKNKVFINGVAFEELTESSEYSSLSFVLTNAKKPELGYSLDIAIERTLLNYFIPLREVTTNSLLTNEIVIKQGFPLMDESGVSTVKILSEDVYMYNGAYNNANTAETAANNRQAFYLGYRGFYETADEAKITHASFEEDYDHNLYRVILTLDGITDSNAKIYNGGNTNYLLRTNQATINNNNKGSVYSEDGEITTDGLDFCVAGEDKPALLTDANMYFSATGMRYFLSHNITINGVSVADWKTRPIKAAEEAGITSGKELRAAFAVNACDLDGWNDVYIKDGNKIVIELYKATSRTVTYTDADGAEQTKTVNWNVPDLSGDIEIKILPGFAAKGLKCSTEQVATLNAENGTWNCSGKATTKVPEEIKVLGLGAPKYWDGDWQNFGIDIKFDKQETDGNMINFSAVGSHNYGTNSDGAHRDLALALGEYGIFESVRKNIIIGGVFGDGNTEFRTMSILDMMKATGDRTGNGSALLHLLPNASRVVIPGSQNDKFTAWYPFHVTDMAQNFTVTIKAGLRVPGVAVDGVYPVYETKQDYNFIYEPDEGKWYEGTTVADIYAAEAQPVIDAIAELPEVADVTLNDKLAVEAARDEYDYIYHDEAKALVTNYEKLQALEAKIAELENGEEKPNPGPEPTPDPDKTEDEGGCGSDIGGVASLAAAMALLAALGLTVIVKRGKKA